MMGVGVIPAGVKWGRNYFFYSTGGLGWDRIENPLQCHPLIHITHVTVIDHRGSQTFSPQKPLNIN